MRKQTFWLAFFLLFFWGSLEVTDYKTIKENVSNNTSQSGVFEWNENRIYSVQQACMLQQELSATRWYQEIAFPVEEEPLGQFIAELSGQGSEVYALVGEKDWGYEKDGDSLIAYIRQIDQYNRKAEENSRIRGIMADIEPYVMKKWKDDRIGYMNIYVNGMIKAYEYAKEKGLVFILCIPRHYDDQGLEEQLERLIAKGCDEVAVMDYECGNEVDKIKTEAELAYKYGKVLHCILEFQEVGKHELTEDKTYHNKGLAAARAAWDEVDSAYPGLCIIRDYHWSEPVWKLLEEERNEGSSEAGEEVFAYGDTETQI